MILEIIICSLVIMLASLAGVFSVWKKAGKLIEKNLCFLVSFSAGVFLVVSYELSRESLEHSSNKAESLLWILSGAALILIIFKLLPSFHHHHQKETDDCCDPKLDSKKILFSDSIHNIGDGFLLAASFAVNSTLGFVTALSIFIHEFVQEISEFFILKQSGFSTKKALITNFLISGTILIGAIGGIFLLDNFEKIEGPLLGLAAGSFLVVVFNDLIPHSIRKSREKLDYSKHVLWFLIGIILITFVNLFASHEHGHEDSHEHESSHSEEMEMIHEEEHHEDH